MDIQGYGKIRAAINPTGNNRNIAEVDVIPWPLGQGSMVETETDFDPGCNLAEGEDCRFVQLAFPERTNQVVSILNMLDRANLIARGDAASPTQKPSLRVIGITATNGYMEISLEDLSAQ